MLSQLHVEVLQVLRAGLIVVAGGIVAAGP